MSDQILDNTGNGGTTVRPTFLTVLCVLTFIGSGLGILVYLLFAIAFSAMSGMLSRIPGMDSLLSGGIAFFAVMLVLAIVSLYGAIQMWKLKKMGFYLYVAANSVGFILPLVWIGIPFDILGLIIVALWFTLYGLNLKHMS